MLRSPPPILTDYPVGGVVRVRKEEGWRVKLVYELSRYCDSGAQAVADSQEEK